MNSCPGLKTITIRINVMDLVDSIVPNDSDLGTQSRDAFLDTYCMRGIVGCKSVQDINIQLICYDWNAEYSSGGDPYKGVKEAAVWMEEEFAKRGKVVKVDLSWPPC